MTITLDIPPLPVASAHAWGLIRHPDPTVDDLARIVNGDAGFTSAVLRAANSAASAPIEPVSTGRDAIVRQRAQSLRRSSARAISCQESAAMLASRCEA